MVTIYFNDGTLRVVQLDTTDGIELLEQRSAIGAQVSRIEDFITCQILYAATS